MQACASDAMVGQVDALAHKRSVAIAWGADGEPEGRRTMPVPLTATGRSTRSYRAGNAWVARIDVPKWFSTLLRKDRADWFESFD